MAFRLEPKVYDHDCTGEPEHWPFGNYAPTEASAPAHAPVRPGDPCAGGCGRSAGQQHSDTPEALWPFCRLCRYRGIRAVRRGQITLAAVADRLREGPRKPGRPRSAV